MWEEGDEFGGFAGVAHRDDEVVGGEDAEVTVESVLAVEGDGGGTGAVEGGDEFFPDVAGFADAHDHDFLTLVQGIFQGEDGIDKGLIEVLGELSELRSFDFKNLASFCKEVHRGKSAGFSGGGQFK